ncbi:MAG TPA: MBL fold metallo-hydrolase [Dokdonella sp.]|uniref:MBL fold metallo-hydrolase n=1 Tax=Dokdonella sp. TaxID=2291710 RepID=UPI002D80C62B|nr:MBL fold metallo-hydrolase [Dokdonella sp.]HET9032255.1 MBL fold metallo-hydrolase [Dokdonella sp.]
MNPNVRSFHHSNTGTWTHVVVDPATRRASIIDPVLDFDMASGRVSTESAQRILEYVATTELAIDWILETHAHADHLSAAAWLKRQLADGSAEPAIGIGHGITTVQKTFKKKFNLDDQFVPDGRQFDALFVDGETLCVGDLDGQIIATPGHTPDSITYQFGDALFVGDTIFSPRGGTARCDFPGADAATLYRSIQRLYSLPDATRVFLAHDYPAQGEEAIAQTTIGDEKATNIHLRGDTSAADFIALRTKRDASLATPKLLWPALQVNIRGGQLPAPETRDQAFLKIPLDSKGFDT